MQQQKTITIQDIKEVFVAWTNSDCTEGRGHSIPIIVADTFETADRLGKGRYIQGSDCPVSKEIAVQVDGLWLVPGHIMRPSQKDHERKMKREKKSLVLAKAKAAGLSDEDLAILANN